MDFASLNNATQFICFFIVICFLWDVFTLRGEHRDFRSLIVTAGIFGTFLGIFLGLLEFDTQDIEASVPPLLEGMKTAFLTSVVGLGASAILTFFAIVTGKEEQGGEVGALKDVEDKLQELVDETKTGFKVTNYNLEQALKKLSEGATAQIIQALESVIADFNNNLKEQFGENFKQLNDAVFKLLEWQSNYSSHVENSTNQLVEATKSIKRAVEATVEATTALETVNVTIEHLLSVSKNVENNTEQTNTALIAQKKMLADFDQILENFKSNLEATSSQTDQLTETIKKSLSSQSETLNQLTNSIKEKLPESLGQLERTLTGLTQKFGDDYQKFLDATATLIRNAKR
ncbi:MAG: hypothetical protein R3332_03580 [Pseudohongiellaceae bacterium]|nr:hypothetical protein [Pseudohongiellaceae bacterium]